MENTNIKEQEKIEALLKPRYKVISDYPGSEFIKNQIITPLIADKYAFPSGIVLKLTAFPHLFRKLQWWEERTVEEMPEYVKQLSNGKVCRIINWHDKLIQFFWVGTDTRNIQHASDEVIPITGDEYKEKIIIQ